MANQTAIEWLEDNLNFEPYDEEDFINNNKIWEQAKVIEKQQIKNAFIKGENTFTMNADKYYNETYLK